MRLVLVADAGTAPPPAADVRVVVLDTAWTPAPGDRPDLVPLRPAVDVVLDREDDIDVAIDLVDAWAARLGLDASTTVRSISWWHRRTAWRWVVARLQWRAILVELLDQVGAGGDRIQELVLPAGAGVLGEVAGDVAAERGIRCTSPEAPGDGDPGAAGREEAAAGLPAPSAAPGIGILDRVRWRLGRHPRQVRKRELDRRTDLLDGRVDGLVAEGGGRLLVVTVPRVHQRIGGPDGPLGDPFVGRVAERLRGTRLDPVTLARELDRTDDATWPQIEGDPRLLPESLLRVRWQGDGDDAAAAEAASVVSDALDRLVPLAAGEEVGRLGSGMLDSLRQHARGSLSGLLRRAFRIERLLRELRPAGILLYNEYGRLEWLAGASWAGVPVFAVQHGVICPGHVGYRHPRSPGRPLPDCTFVFGPYEARVLLEHGGYRPEEVLVTGSPRLRAGLPAADPSVSQGVRAAERRAVRRELDVADGDRLLVVSTTHEPDLRQLHWNHALARLLDGPLPGVHLVFKQHPAEADRGDYEALVEGLARAGGYPPPPCSVVRDVDLYRLLRAADVHLGIYSTVLSDAVAVGTPNLIAFTQARVDLLGYVTAGVAVPVRSHAELAAAVAVPPVIDPAARRAFLDDHFLPGDGADRIAEALLAATERNVSRTAGSPAQGNERPGTEDVG